jgi:hypothetical protein
MDKGGRTWDRTRDLTVPQGGAKLQIPFRLQGIMGWNIGARCSRIPHIRAWDSDKYLALHEGKTSV